MSETIHSITTIPPNSRRKSERSVKNMFPKEESKMEQLRRLDASATKPGIIAAMTLGIISTLVLGVGMCCVMVWEDRLFIPGIIIGVIGILGIVLAYPLYNRMTKKRREKLAPEILRLTDELSKQG